MGKKVLVTYGDGYGPTVIQAAESVIRTVAPDLDILHGKIGADAYDNTAYALPPETISLIAECDAMLSGPVVMGDIRERDPLTTIKKQMGLYLEYEEFFPLCKYLGTGDIDAIVVSPSSENSLNVYETESLDGVTSEYFTSIETLSKIFSKTMNVSECKRRREISLVNDGIVYPVRDILIRSEFHKHFAATEFRTRDLGTSEAMYILAHDPSDLDVVLCDIHAGACVKGQATGIVGGSGLMPRAFLGDSKGLYMASEVYPTDAVSRELNPTSAILSAGVMLLNLGYEEAYDLIRRSVCEMYRKGETTSDVGGTLNAKKFTIGVNKLILSEINS